MWDEVYRRFDAKTSTYVTIGSDQEAREFLKKAMGTSKLRTENKQKSIKVILRENGFRSEKDLQRYHDRSREKVTYIPVKPLDFFVIDFNTGEPIKIDGKMITSPTHGPLHRWISENLQALSENMDSEVSRNGVRTHHFAVKRFMKVVPEGEHTHYKHIDTTRFNKGVR